ncbi:MAG: lamin tail domain-containing protein [bacterium]
MWRKVIIILLVFLKIEIVWGQDTVIINEVMFDAPSFVGDFKGEWVELYNPTQEEIDISKWIFNDGSKDKIIPAATTIKSYDYLVLIEDKDTFNKYGYPDQINIVELGNFSLDDNTDTLTLKDNLTPVNILTYDNDWGAGTVNSGRTLEKIYPSGSNTDFYWDSSKTPYGTPGKQNSVYLDVPGIQGVKLLINEIMFSTSNDWVEVYCVDDGNKGNGAEIKGFYFNDLDGDEDKIIGSCTIKTGEFLLLHYGLAGQDDTFGINGRINLFTDKESITSTTDQMVLFNLLDEIIDGVCWANDTPPADEDKDRNELINSLKWQGEAIDSTKVSAGQSIARNALSDTNSKNDWYVSIPTSGLPNEIISSAEKPPEIRIVTIINKTLCPEEGKNFSLIYSLSKSSYVSIRIYDIRGRLVKRLIEQEYKIAKEDHRITWNGQDEDGDILPIGVYICYLEAVGEGGASSVK